MNKIKKHFKNLKKYIEDILIISGSMIVLTTTLLLNVYIGLYLLGIMLIGLGIFLIKFPRK